MNANNWSQRREPFAKEDEWTTENGTHVKTGEKILAKPTYIDERLPAMVETIYWDPQGLPGSKFDHRGEKVGEDEDGMPVFENPSGYDCVLTVLLKFVPDDAHEYAHMNGKTEKVEAYNLDFVIGKSPDIRSDRANCEA